MSTLMASPVRPWTWSTLDQLPRQPAKMAYNLLDEDCDSTFGEDPSLWLVSMIAPSPAPLAGTKRDADDIDDFQTKTAGLAASQEHRAEHIDPRTICCGTCPEIPPCTALPDSRPSKRIASARKVSEFHRAGEHFDMPSTPDHALPDTCFSEFCHEEECDATCSSSCTPCPGDECSAVDACCNPRCDQSCDQTQCFDNCVDPECTKFSCPNQPCFCQNCEVQSCPLGDLGNECHLAHSAPMASGTIYCYDSAPCHFQNGHQILHSDLPPYDSDPCYSQFHSTIENCNVAHKASSSAASIISPGNYTSLGSISHQSSPYPGQTSMPPNCGLNINFDHCHMFEDCCHGTNRQCEDTALGGGFEFWDSSMLPGSGLENAFMNFGFTSPSCALPPALNGAYGNTSGLENMHWTYPYASFPSMSSTDRMDSNFGREHISSEVEDKHLGAHSTCALEDLGDYTVSTPYSRPTTSASSSRACFCRWQNGSLPCLQAFDSPEALHKHIKSAHVDSCISCFCQWEGCESSSKDFKQRSKLSRHLLGHAGHRPYACSFEGCDKTFATNQAKDNHERTHTGARPYACEHCSYTTTTHTQLQTHISALHLNHKRHKCRFCEFTCADSSNLSKHERTHQTLRPYRCPHVGCTFKPDCRWENLKRHLRRSGHCPELLADDSQEYKDYREGVKSEIEDWHKRNNAGGAVKARRKGAKTE
ncbi:hypothetical protein EJ04DRAFT_495640 [Polyplosphaeria fusca]|uniref:C2H2-type domain-containing protein n=1 Tax=Polyplosphaeria fusca TaxID=682080 RepID=A0A9P4QVD5_9PLEO|nr:hypothetical protein EJ04DRAFT_495640 [Polyplosphaeria fusca]